MNPACTIVYDSTEISSPENVINSLSSRFVKVKPFDNKSLKTYQFCIKIFVSSGHSVNVSSL